MAEPLGKEWNGELVPYGQPYDTGYDANAVRETTAGFNAILRDESTHEYVPLWITDIITSFALSGNRGQSWGTRTLFPRNFVQPSFQILAIAPSQQNLGKVAEFVHRMQRKGIFQNVLTGLTVPGSGVKRPNSGTKGTHAGLSATGYIKSFPREHAQGVFAPEYQFEFVVARIRSSIFHEEEAVGRVLKSWSDIIQGLVGDNFGATFTTTPPQDQPQNGPTVAPGPGGSGQRPT